MNCVICGRPAHGPVSVADAVHEMLCAEHFRQWVTSPGFSLSVQLELMGRLREALAQYRDFVYRARSEVKEATT